MSYENLSPTEAADSLSRGHLANVTSKGSVAFNGLREVESMSTEDFSRFSKSSSIPVAAEAEDGSPVASGADLLELYGSIQVAQGYMTETKMRSILANYRQAVSR